MGWSETYKPRGQSLKDFFNDEFSYGDDHPEAGIVDLATAGWNLAYAAVKHPKGYVFAATIQIRYLRNAYYNILYRVDDESVGPNHRTCPQRILDQLTPDQEVIEQHGWDPAGHWKGWRDACRANLEAKQTRPKVRDGDIIRFENPLTFTDGSQSDTFVLRRQRTYRGGTSTHFTGTTQDAQGNIREGYGRYRITRWRERSYRVIGHAPRT